SGARGLIHRLGLHDNAVASREAAGCGGAGVESALHVADKLVAGVLAGEVKTRWLVRVADAGAQERADRCDLAGRGEGIAGLGPGVVGPVDESRGDEVVLEALVERVELVVVGLLAGVLVALAAGAGAGASGIGGEAAFALGALRVGAFPRHG